MRWLAFQIDTTHEASELITDFLSSLGADGVQVEDAAEIRALLADPGSLAYADDGFIDSLDEVADLDRECGDIGVDTIEAGNTIAVAMEGGLLEFGDAEGAFKTFDEIRKGTPLGRILGQGVVATAKAFGVSRVPTVK